MDNDDIAARWPDLVHVRVSAFGADSPWPAVEPIAALVEARLGVMAEQDGPTRVRTTSVIRAPSTQPRCSG